MGQESVRLAKKEVPTGLFTLLSPVTLGLEGPASTLGLSRFRAASGTWVFRGPGPQKQDWTSLRAFGITHAVCEFPPGLCCLFLLLILPSKHKRMSISTKSDFSKVYPV